MRIKRTAKIVKTTSGKKVIKIQFPWSREDTNRVKKLPNATLYSKAKCWTVPVKAKNVKALKSWGFTVSLELEELVSFKAPKLKNIPGFGVTPRPFQYEGISLLQMKNGRALLADEMGLGKTIQALGWFQLNLKKTPLIIICPSSLKLNWKNETIKCLSKYHNKIQILEGQSIYQIWGKIIIINYDILHFWRDELQRKKAKSLFADECHYIKTEGTQRTTAIKELVRKIPHVIMISGTPIENRPVEIFNAINIIDPKLFPSPYGFKHKFCGPKMTKRGWEFKGATNKEELHRILISSIMIRRKKRDVLKELPAKSYSFIPLELDNREEYDFAYLDVLKYLKKTKGKKAKKAKKRAKRAKFLVQMNILKQLAVEGKMKQSIEWIKNFLESGEKLVVFGIHKKTINALMEAFPKAVKIDGSVASNKRQAIVDKFQNDPRVNLFIGNLKAAGVGLTLTAASNVVILELPDNPALLSQAIDRIHRISQLKQVVAWFLLAQGTIEEDIAKNLDRKTINNTNILDGEFPNQDELISRLMKQLKI